MARLNAKQWREQRARRILASKGDRPMSEQETVSEAEVVEPEVTEPEPKRKGRGLGGGFSSNNADEVWPEIVSGLGKANEDPYEVEISVTRLQPGARTPLSRSFNGSMVRGSATQSPEDALVQYVDRNFHLPTQRGPSTYEIVFKRRLSKQIIKRANLERPSPADIHAVEQAATGALPSYAHLGVAAPAPQQAPPSPAQSGAPIIHNYPPAVAPSVPRERDPYVDMLVQQNQQLMEKLLAHNIPVPQGLGAQPTQSPITVETIAAAVAVALRQVGLGAPPPAVTAPLPQRASQKVSELRDLVDAVRSLKSLSSEVDKIFAPETEGTGLGDPEPPPDPDEDSPFKVMTVPGTGEGGKAPWRYAINKETKDVDWAGTGIANGEHIGQTLSKVVDMAEKVVKRLANSAPEGPEAGESPPAFTPPPNGSSEAGGGWGQG
jgi:hypothetical protein